MWQGLRYIQERECSAANSAALPPIPQPPGGLPCRGQFKTAARQAGAILAPSEELLKIGALGESVRGTAPDVILQLHTSHGILKACWGSVVGVGSTV